MLFRSLTTIVIGTNQADQFTFATLPNSNTRVFSGGGDDRLDLLASPGNDPNGAESNVLIFNAGEGNDEVNLVSDQAVAANLVLDDRTVIESGRRLVLGEDTETLNVDLRTDVDNDIRVEKNWDVQKTTISTAGGDDTIHVEGLLHAGQSMTVTTGVGEDVVTFNEDCIDGLIAVDDEVTTGENQSITIPVVDNDLNFDLGEGIIELGNSEDSDRVSITSLDGRPALQYEPLPGFTGADSFTYNLRVGNSVATGTVRVEVAAENDAPEAVDDTANVHEDNAVLIEPLANDRDQDGDSLSILSFTQPSAGLVEQIDEGFLQYTPPVDFNGTVMFDYTTQDPGGLTSTAAITVVVVSRPDGIEAVDDLVSTDQDFSLTIDVLANDRDPDGDTVDVQVLTQPANGTVTPGRGDTLIYTPVDGFSGANQFRYQIRDEDGNISAATVTINVIGTDPVAVDDTADVGEDAAVSIDVLQNDLNVDDGTEVVQLELDADFGSIVQVENGRFDYTPNPDFFGSDVFSYRVTNADGDTSTAQVTVTVKGINDAPTALDDFVNVNEDGSVEIDVLENDTDPDGDELTPALIGDPAHGVVTLNADHTFTYVPVADYDGPDSFTYSITDAVGETSTATVNLTVTPDGIVENIAPTILSISTDAELPTPSEDGTVHLSGTFEDMNIDDTHRVVVDWGDGSDPATISHADFAFSQSHFYQTGGLFEITVTVTDAEGASDVAVTTAAITGVGLQNGVLQVIGSSTHDRIGVYPHQDQLRIYFRVSGRAPVRVNLPMSDVTSIEAVTGPGHDTIDISSQLSIPATIESGDGNDWIAAGQGNDIIFSGPGRDKIVARGGDDFVDAGDDRDLIFAGSGMNEVFGRGGDDLIFGGPDVERLFGGDGRDLIKGNDGDDLIDGGLSNDKLFDGRGDDKIAGDGGNDLLIGGAGDDELDGGEGDDRIFGRRGNDRIFGGSGHDYLNGSHGDDMIRAGDGNDTLIGGNGDDQLFGEAGNDRLHGGYGDDLLDGGSGHNTLDPGPGNETATAAEGERTTDDPNEPFAELLPSRDVNADGQITPLDALLIINRLAREGTETEVDAPLDTNQDGSVSAIDALLIINHLGRSPDVTDITVDAVESASHEEVDWVTDQYASQLSDMIDEISTLLPEQDDDTDEMVDQLLSELDAAV